MAALLASGYHGPPELTPLRARAEWTLDPWALVFVLLLGGLYLAGVWRVRQAESWPAWRAVAFCGLGLGFAVIATMSWVGVYQPALFYVRSVQTILLLLVVVPFVLYFSPWYAAGFHATLVRELTYVALLIPGFVFFWTLLRVDPV